MGALGELVSEDKSVASDALTSATANGPGRSGPVQTKLGIGAVRLGQQFGSPDDATLRARLDNVADQFGLTVADSQILHPLESAVQIALIVPDGTKIDWTIDQLRAAIVGQTPDVEGVLIELDSPTGEKLLQSGVAYRTGEGGLWFAAGQDVRFNALHGTLGKM